MNKVLVYSLLLIVGLVGSQIVPPLLGGFWPAAALFVRLATMVALTFIRIYLSTFFSS